MMLSIACSKGCMACYCRGRNKYFDVFNVKFIIIRHLLWIKYCFIGSKMALIASIYCLCLENYTNSVISIETGY